MASSNRREDEQLRLRDIRVEAAGTGHSVPRLLENVWPSVPGANSFGSSAAIDCMAILLRMQWTRLESIPMPSSIEETALAQYSWLMFDPFTTGNDKLVEAARKEVVMNASLQADIGEDFSFAHLCRSEMAIETLWQEPHYQLTYPWVHQSSELPFARPPSDPKILARWGSIQWDGVRPATIHGRVNQVTGQQATSNGVGTRYFQSPALLQVDLEPDQGCDKSLIELFLFSANKWVMEYDKTDIDSLVMRQRGQQAYMLRAVVKHRKGPEEPDLIKLFGKEGIETVPSNAAHLDLPNWGFETTETIPPGITLSLFYETVSCVSPVIKVNRHQGSLKLSRGPEIKIQNILRSQMELTPSTPQTDCVQAFKSIPLSDNMRSFTPSSLSSSSTVGSPSGCNRLQGIDAPVHVHAPDRILWQRQEGGQVSCDLVYTCEDKRTVEQEKASMVCQPRAPKTHASSSTPINRDPGAWPVGGFADDDSAAAYMLDVMRKRGSQKVHTLTIEEVDLIHTTGQDKGLRPYQQVTRSERVDSVYKRYNFILPHPDLLGHVMGKVVYSKAGLTTIIQGLQTVVCKYKGGPAAKLPPLQQQVDRLVAAKGTMDYNRPFRKGQTYFVLCDPYTPEGVRSALAGLDLAIHHSPSGRMLFYAHPLDKALRGDGRGALLDIHPIIGWPD